MMTLCKNSFLQLVVKRLPCFIDISVRNYIACVFSFESDFGRSSFACCLNNYSGLKVNPLRLTYAVNYEETAKFAKYVSFGDCVSDYLLWLSFNRFYKCELLDVYAFRNKLLLSGYSKELGIIESVDDIYRKYFDKNFNS